VDKKTKKRVDVLHQKAQKLKQQLSASKRQADDPDEPRRLEAEIAAIEAELARLNAAR
jgi:hypothetical protein